MSCRSLDWLSDCVFDNFSSLLFIFSFFSIIPILYQVFSYLCQLLHYVGVLIVTKPNFISPWELTRRPKVCLSCLPRLRLQQLITSVNSNQLFKWVFIVMSFFPLACTAWEFHSIFLRVVSSSTVSQSAFYFPWLLDSRLDKFLSCQYKLVVISLVVRVYALVPHESSFPWHSFLVCPSLSDLILRLSSVFDPV